jgi:hypothetical protein
MSKTRTIEKLLRQQSALANFGSFAFREPAPNQGPRWRPLALAEIARGDPHSL